MMRIPRFHFLASWCPMSRISAHRRRSRRWRNRRRPGAGSAICSRTPWWNALEASGAPKIIARLLFLERADSSGGAAGVRDLAVADDAMVTEVDVEPAFRLNADTARAPRRWPNAVRLRLRRRCALVSVAGYRVRRDQDGPDQGRRLGAHRLSSAATQRAIRCWRTGLPGRRAALQISGVDDEPPQADPGIPILQPRPARAWWGRRVFGLSANEMPFKCRRRRSRSWEAAAIWRLSEGTAGARGDRLRPWLDRNCIICGAGLDEISIFGPHLSHHGDEAISTTYGFWSIRSRPWPMAPKTGRGGNRPHRHVGDPEAGIAKHQALWSPTRIRPGPPAVAEVMAAPTRWRRCCWC